jgi:hypothetical protein
METKEQSKQIAVHFNGIINAKKVESSNHKKTGAIEKPNE